MAIIYTYPPVSNPQGNELVVVTDVNNKNATRLMTVQEIANFAPDHSHGPGPTPVSGCPVFYQLIPIIRDNVTNLCTPNPDLPIIETCQTEFADFLFSETNRYVQLDGENECYQVILKPLYQSIVLQDCETCGAVEPTITTKLEVCNTEGNILYSSGDFTGSAVGQVFKTDNVCYNIIELNITNQNPTSSVDFGVEYETCNECLFEEKIRYTPCDSQVGLPDIFLINDEGQFIEASIASTSQSGCYQRSGTANVEKTPGLTIVPGFTDCTCTNEQWYRFVPCVGDIIYYTNETLTPGIKDLAAKQDDLEAIKTDQGCFKGIVPSSTSGTPTLSLTNIQTYEDGDDIADNACICCESTVGDSPEFGRIFTRCGGEQEQIIVPSTSFSSNPSISGINNWGFTPTSGQSNSYVLTVTNINTGISITDCFLVGDCTTSNITHTVLSEQWNGDAGCGHPACPDTPSNFWQYRQLDTSCASDIPWVDTSSDLAVLIPGVSDGDTVSEYTYDSGSTIPAYPCYEVRLGGSGNGNPFPQLNVNNPGYTIFPTCEDCIGKVQVAQGFNKCLNTDPPKQGCANLPQNAYMYESYAGFTPLPAGSGPYLLSDNNGNECCYTRTSAFPFIQAQVAPLDLYNQLTNELSDCNAAPCLGSVSTVYRFQKCKDASQDPDGGTGCDSANTQDLVLIDSSVGAVTAGVYVLENTLGARSAKCCYETDGLLATGTPTAGYNFDSTPINCSDCQTPEPKVYKFEKCKDATQDPDGGGGCDGSVTADLVYISSSVGAVAAGVYVLQNTNGKDAECCYETDGLLETGNPTAGYTFDNTTINCSDCQAGDTYWQGKDCDGKVTGIIISYDGDPTTVSIKVQYQGSVICMDPSQWISTSSTAVNATVIDEYIDCTECQDSEKSYYILEKCETCTQEELPEIINISEDRLSSNIGDTWIVQGARGIECCYTVQSLNEGNLDMPDFSVQGSNVENCSDGKCPT